MKDAAISRRDRPSSQCGSERRARPKKGKGNGSKSDSDSESVRQGDAQTAATDSRQTRRKICFSFRICIVQHSQIHTRISQRRCQGQSQLLPFDCLYFHAQLHSTLHTILEEPGRNYGGTGPCVPQEFRFRFDRTQLSRKII